MAVSPAMTDATDSAFMQQALVLARQAEANDEVPVGAVMTLNDEIIAAGYNQAVNKHDASAHAEIIAIKAAGKRLANYRLINTTLYVTLEPCAMCAGAIVHARVARVVYGAADPKTGAAGSVFNLLQSDQLNHRTAITAGVLAEDCSRLLTDFFRDRR